MELLEDFWYEDPKGKRWNTPKGSTINGATIPKALWSIVGPPFVGKYRRASVIHDYAVGEGSAPDVGLSGLPSEVALKARGNGINKLWVWPDLCRSLLSCIRPTSELYMGLCDW